MTGAPEILGFDAQADLVRQLAGRVSDRQLEDPTPCEQMAVRHLLGHLDGLAMAFRDAARKELGPTTDTAPDSSVPDVDDDWRGTLPLHLTELATAWQRPEAWEGDTRAGGVPLPAAVAGRVAMDELVLHGWDLARATGQPYTPATAHLEVCHELLAATPDGPERAGMFGQSIPVPSDAPLLDRVVALSGRDPAWTPPEA